ncbi:predicted protein [Uncinocarpus reesii 1704]|uniref:Pentacotripeptide-repeat region of PRORP domain-containing protein n=1 Tax=Uncinocarpus reesii (strain UAMH 1704) TaxID=336963 RepID=C4JVF2_UNCRE|nr:uncharacterized protein UREG_06544 [Uncinocarpus reesii 1704]EEP81679.1 predicted protein [Uncinocarpus reesii 1704]
MLERAARCIETVGQQIFLCSQSPLRSQRILRSNFWHHSAVDIDIPFWCFGFLSSQHSPGETDRVGGGHRISSDHFSYLEFLYPPRTRSFARSYLRTRNLHKTTNVRRRKRFSYRGFASSTDAVEGSITVSEAPSRNVDNKAVLAELRRLLKNEYQPDYSKAWKLFQAAGSPAELSSQMLAYLSASDKRSDASRTKVLFDGIPVSKRKAKDYLCAIKTALIWNFEDFDVKDIYNEAASRNEEELCWGFTIALLVNRRNWHDALEIWNNRPNSAPDSEKQVESAELSELPGLPNRVISLLKDIQNAQLHKDAPGLMDLIRFMVNHVVSSQKFMTEMSTKSMLSLFELLDSLQLHETRFYFQGISTLQSLCLRPAHSRSMLLYRNFRWRLPEERVPQPMLNRFLKNLSALKISKGVDYLLDEYRLLYGKPSPEAYRYGLTTFARLGKESEVNRLFRSYVEDFGVPSDLKLLSPLLYVHARLGQVKETQEQLDRLSKDFDVSPNVICWNILLTAHAKSEDLTGAITTFKTMIQNEITPDTHTFGILMGLLANKGDVDAVINLFNFAKQNKVRISCALIDGIVEALCNNRRYSDAEKVANEALHLDFSGSLTRMWNVLLWNYAFIPDIDSVSRIQGQMQQEGIEFDGMTYAALMLSLVRIGKLESARQILAKLHRSRRTHITELHYAILLHGYLKEKNRDMILVLYKEMAARFETLGLSGNLSMLRANISRDLQRFREKGGIYSDDSVDLSRAERLLDVIIENFDVSMLATKQPQPGAKRRSVRSAFPSAYYEPLVLAYGSQGEFQKANNLVDKYHLNMKRLALETQSSSLQFLHAEMTNYMRQGKHDKVDVCWKKAVEDTKRVARPTDLKTLMDRSHNTPEISDLSRSHHQETSSHDADSGILPSYRFALSRCISVVMQSLSYRNLHSKIAQVIAEVEKIGFALTTFNWSLYIKLLCTSRRPVDQFLAFTLFEEKFISNFISWAHIKRGYTKRPVKAPAGLDYLERRIAPLQRHQVLGKAGRQAWAQIQPDSMQPTYLTMLYLASALIDFRSRSIASGEGEMDQLLSKAPQTVNAVAKLPFLREKFQGLILRGRRDIEEELGPEPVKTTDHVVWTGGVLGVDGETRIDTSPMVMEPEDVTPSDHAKPHRRREYVSMPGEDFSEPDADMLETMLAEDAEWKATHFKPGAPFEIEPAERVLEAQDELDLESESRLEVQQGEE